MKNPNIFDVWYQKDTIKQVALALKSIAANINSPSFVEKHGQVAITLTYPNCEYKIEFSIRYHGWKIGLHLDGCGLNLYWYLHDYSADKIIESVLEMANNLEEYLI